MLFGLSFNFDMFELCSAAWRGNGLLTVRVGDADMLVRVQTCPGDSDRNGGALVEALGGDKVWFSNVFGRLCVIPH